MTGGPRHAAEPPEVSAADVARVLALGEERFVSLTTFRKNGVRVSTPVWIVRDGDRLLVTTPAESGKVKRLRNSDRVELRPCSRSGQVDESREPVPARAVIRDDSVEVSRGGELFLRKYTLEYRVFMVIERIAARRRKRRVMLHVHAVPGSAPPA